MENWMLEGNVALMALAARTQKLHVGLMVGGVTYRNPAFFAKQTTTIDVLSGGRAIFGIGAAWNGEGSAGLGLFFPPTAERFERLEETLQYLLQMWSDDDGPFNGRHYQAERLMNVPQALSRPHPPIMVGGGGEKKTLRLVAKYAQACNVFNTPDLEHKLDVLKQHCDNEGRNYDDITKTVYHLLDTGENGEKTSELIDELGRLHTSASARPSAWSRRSPASTYWSASAQTSSQSPKPSDPRPPHKRSATNHRITSPRNDNNAGRPNAHRRSSAQHARRPHRPAERTPYDAVNINGLAQYLSHGTEA
jgi:alkanesulfonate monooxygenase SsuD/methylene tetrahydromethanopterin reductase-like flavin-dependent oxidoreductase (luciferase family)